MELVNFIAEIATEFWKLINRRIEKTLRMGYAEQQSRQQKAVRYSI